MNHNFMIPYQASSLCDVLEICQSPELFFEHLQSIQVNEQLSPVWSSFLTSSHKKQDTQLNSTHNMNNTSEVVTLSIIALNLGAPVKNDWLLKWPKNKI